MRELQSSTPRLSALLRRVRYKVEEAQTLDCANLELPVQAKCHCSKSYCESELVPLELDKSCNFQVNDGQHSIKTTKAFTKR
jgi:hypothetical protein